MVEAIAYTVLLFAAAVGFVHLFGVLENKLLFRKRKTSVISVIPLSGRVEEIELLVRDLLSLKHRNQLKQDAIVLVDVGMDDETRDICEKMSKDNSGIVVCDDCQLENLLQRSIGCK